MQFANPIWLWALSGLLIPIGIHLFSRKEGDVIPMGSIRYLRESPTARYKNIRLNEVVLLLLRCLLIALLVFLLADAELSWSPGQDRRWLLIEPGLEHAGDLSSIIEEAQQEGFEIRSLSGGFPLASGKSARAPVYSYWSALQELASQDLDSVVVISYSHQRNFRGGRMALPSHIRWISYPSGPEAFVAQAFSLSADSVLVRKGKTTPSITRYETLTVPMVALHDSVRVTEPEELAITIYTGDDFLYDAQIVRASLEAIQSITPHKLSVTTKKAAEAQEGETDIILWLADQPPPGYAGSLTIAYHQCMEGKLPLLVASGNVVRGCPGLKNVSWVLTRRLTDDIALHEHLALSLAQIILPSTADDHNDQRVLPEAMMWSSIKTPNPKSTVKGETGNTDFVIVIFFALVLLAERAVAYKRKQ